MPAETLVDSNTETADLLDGATQTPPDNTCSSIPPSRQSERDATSSGNPMVGYEREVNRHLRRNILFHVLDGGVFFFGLTFISFETIIPVFITRLGGSNFTVALVPFLWLVTISLGPVMVARRIEQQDRKMNSILTLGLVMRLPWLILGGATLLFGANRPGILIPATIAAVLIFGLFDGLSLTPFFDLVGRAVPVRVRGRALSARLVLGYGLGILGGLAVTQILSRIAFPHGYAVLFFLAFGLMFVSLIFIALMKEPVYPHKVEHKKGLSYVIRLVGILKSDAHFTNFNISRAFLLMLFSTSAFYSAYGIRHFALPDSFAGIFTTVAVVSCMVVSPIVGILGDKKGHKKNLLIGIAVPSLAAGVALLSPDPRVYCAVFVVVAIVQMVYFVSIENMILEYSRPEERPTYIALSGLLMLPVGLFTLALGAIADWLGYQPLFALIILTSVAGTLFTAIKVHDPTAPGRHSFGPAPDADAVKQAGAYAAQDGP